MASDSDKPSPDGGEQYRFCHQLLLENISILEKTEIYATGAIAAAMVFSISVSEPTLALASSLVPSGIAAVGLMRWFGIDRTIGTINDYLEILESDSPEGGWTKYYRSRRQPALRRSRKMIWTLLVCVSVGFAILMYIHGPFTRSH